MCPWGGRLTSHSAHSSPSPVAIRDVGEDSLDSQGYEVMKRLSWKRLGRGYLPGLRTNSHWCWACLHRVSTPWPLVPCSFHQLQCWLCHDSHSLGAGQNTDWTEQWPDSHIFSAEHRICLIKQQITKADESCDSSPNSVALSSSWISIPLTLVKGERRHSRGEGYGS